ncbi:MAG: hypothetical protein JSS02_31825 [Planctomycetes bacterium]|nr:hypothetical protein [Planctomycetota bacterium]
MRKPATKQQIATTIGLLLAVAAAGTWWYPHIEWSYLVSRNKFKLESVKVVPMPEPKPHDGAWFQCQAAALSFSLPPAMADEADRTVSKTPQSLSLTTSTNEVTFFVPSEIPADQTPYVAEIAKKYGMTPFEFIAESYRTSSDDFRWTMTWSQLERYKYLLQMSGGYPHGFVFSVEYYSDPTLEGLLIIHSNKAEAMFEWRLKSGKSAGVLHLKARSGEFNFDELRSIAHSVKCDESKLGPPLTKDQIGVLADTMKIELEPLAGSSGPRE